MHFHISASVTKCVSAKLMLQRPE